MEQKPRHELSNEERRRRDRSLWRTAMGVSLLLHLLLFLAWPSDPLLVSPFSAAGPRAGDDRAASGSMQAMNIRVPPTRPITPPPVPVFTVDPVEMLEFDEEAELEPSAFQGDAPGELEGPGLENGEGEGDGGNADEGRFRVIPPVPRGMIWPPESKKLDDIDLEVWVWVDASGRVVPDSTTLRDPTSDRDFNRRLVAEAAEWIFEPARRGGEPVASWFPYRISR
jgi:hypothetical protein